jgi:hypothetical protein
MGDGCAIGTARSKRVYRNKERSRQHDSQHSTHIGRQRCVQARVPRVSSTRARERCSPRSSARNFVLLERPAKTCVRGKKERTPGRQHSPPRRVCRPLLLLPCRMWCIKGGLQPPLSSLGAGSAGPGFESGCRSGRYPASLLARICFLWPCVCVGVVCTRGLHVWFADVEASKCQSAILWANYTVSVCICGHTCK